MDIKKLIIFDKNVQWKKEHTANAYAMVFRATKIWKFKQEDDLESYTYFKLLIQDYAKPFKWGLQKQKTILVLNHNSFFYFTAPPDTIYKCNYFFLDSKKPKKTSKKTTKDEWI